MLQEEHIRKQIKETNDTQLLENVALILTTKDYTDEYMLHEKEKSTFGNQLKKVLDIFDVNLDKERLNLMFAAIARSQHGLQKLYEIRKKFAENPAMVGLIDHTVDQFNTYEVDFNTTYQHKHKDVMLMLMEGLKKRKLVN